MDNRQLRFLQKLRDRALKKFKKTGLPKHGEYYKQLRNYTTSAIKAEKRAYLHHKFKLRCVKEKWAELKKLNIQKNNNKSIPDNLKNVLLAPV